MRFRLAAVVMLAGCSVLRQGQSDIPGLAGGGQASLASLAAHSLANYRAQATTPDAAASWIAPDAGASTQLLYVSDWATNAVYIYNYATHASAGKLTGFHAPYGQCVDGSGNVWITESVPPDTKVFLKQPELIYKGAT